MNKGGYVSVASLTISDIIKELKLLMRWANFLWLPNHASEKCQPDTLLLQSPAWSFDNVLILKYTPLMVFYVNACNFAPYIEESRCKLKDRSAKGCSWNIWRRVIHIESIFTFHGDFIHKICLKVLHYRTVIPCIHAGICIISDNSKQF